MVNRYFREMGLTVLLEIQDQRWILLHFTSKSYNSKLQPQSFIFFPSQSQIL